MCRVTTPPLADVPVRSSLALTRRWVSLLAPLSFADRSLWLTWLGQDGRQSPVLIPVEDVPVQPDRHLVTRLLDLHSDMAARLPGDDVRRGTAGDPAKLAAPAGDGRTAAVRRR